MRYISIALILFTVGLSAKVFNDPKELMNIYFDNSVITKKTILITKKQQQLAQQLVKTKLNSKIFRFYIAKQGTKIVGYGGLITSNVRTKNSTALVILDIQGNVKAVEVIAFYEPREYIPSQRWLNLFDNKNVEDKLKLKNNIPVITGATLSAKTVTDSVNTILAVWNIYFKGN